MSNVHTVHLHISASFQSSSLNETEFFVYSFELSGTREKRKILLSMGKLMALGYNCYFPITFSFILLFYQLSSVTNLSCAENVLKGWVEILTNTKNHTVMSPLRILMRLTQSEGHLERVTDLQECQKSPFFLV